jgi:hypothetical protein
MPGRRRLCGGVRPPQGRLPGRVLIRLSGASTADQTGLRCHEFEVGLVAMAARLADGEFAFFGFLLDQRRLEEGPMPPGCRHLWTYPRYRRLEAIVRISGLLRGSVQSHFREPVCFWCLHWDSMLERRSNGPGSSTTTNRRSVVTEHDSLLQPSAAA